MTSWFIRQMTRTPAPEPHPARTIAERQAVVTAIAAEHATWESTRARLEARAAATQAREAEIAALLREPRSSASRRTSR